MKLETFLSENKLTDAAFGKLVGLSQSQVNRIKRGVSKPSWDALGAIERATKGAVKAADFMSGEQANA